MKYSTILLIRLTGDRPVPYYWIFQIIRRYLYWTKLLKVIFCYCSYTWAVQLIRRVFYLDISFICSFRVISVLFCVFWSLHSWGSWWHRRQGIWRYNSWCKDTLDVLLNMFLRNACFNDEAFTWHKAKLLILGLLSSSAGLSGFPNYQKTN